MREILFRGKRKDTGAWVFGDLVHSQYKIGDTCVGQYGNTVGIHQVNPETVGQFTGLTDKNGKKIFEGDIFCDLYGCMDGIPRMVRWDEAHMEFKCPLVRKHWAYGNNDSSLWIQQNSNIEVIGNIHDNPELLEV